MYEANSFHIFSMIVTFSVFTSHAWPDCVCDDGILKSVCLRMANKETWVDGIVNLSDSKF